VGNTRINDSVQNQLVRFCEEWTVRTEFSHQFNWKSTWCVNKQRTIEQSLFELYTNGFEEQIKEKLSRLAHQNSISSFKKAMLRERLRALLKTIGLKK
jgi:hypothetical protein